MTKSLGDVLQEMSQFISVEVGESFTGIYRGFQEVPNKFEPEKNTVELLFEIGGSVKPASGVALARAVHEAKIVDGDTVEITKVSKKGNTVTWLVKKVSGSPAQPQQS